MWLKFFNNLVSMNLHVTMNCTICGKVTMKSHIFTARKRSLRRLCFYRCLSVHKGGWYPSMHCRLYPNMPCSRSPRGGGGIPACLVGFQAHTEGGGEIEGDLARGCGVSRPHPRGKLRGIWPGGLQAHTQGGS